MKSQEIMENFKKKYKEVLRKATKIHRDDDEKIKHYMEVLFPELAESEDDRIRKELISFLQLPHPQFVGERKQEKWIAWLEKQGQVKNSDISQHKNKICEENDDYLTEDDRTRKEIIKFIKKRDRSGCDYDYDKWIAWFEKQVSIDENEVANRVLIEVADSIMQWLDSNCAEGNMCLSNMECEDIENAVRNANWQKIYGYMKKKLEKQGWQKPQGKSALEAVKEEKVDNANKIEPKDYSSIDPYFGKPIDKVEPKFHEGDWVLNDVCLPVQIASVKDGLYIFTEGDAMSVSFVDENFHLWTISDAKDGDVLVGGNKDDVILIFRGIGNAEWNDVIDYYCYYDCYRENFIIQKDVRYWGDIKNNQLKPATKEQSARLFQKMKEAGYMWDEKKNILVTKNIQKL